MSDTDRMLGPFAALVRRFTARIDYLALYPAKVLAQNGDGTLELQPDDARLPGLSAVPIRYGIPGVSATVAAGARVLLGFEAGDPQRPVATLWDSASVTKLQVVAAEVDLGAAAPAGFVALATAVEAQLSTLKSAINGAAVAPGDGGATFKTNLMAALAGWPGSVAASKVKAE